MSSSQDADVLVVGAGAAGLTLAIALKRAGLRPLVIEAGPDRPDARWQDRNTGPQPLEAYPGMTDGRMKALGGTTRLWGGQLARITQEEFTNAKNPWPLPWEDYRKSLDHALDLLGMTDVINNAAAEFARQTGGGARIAVGLEAQLNPWLREPDFTRLFSAELRGIEIWCNTMASRLHPAGEGRCSLAVTGSAGEQVLTARAIVLAAGAIENAGILLRSASCDPSLGFATNRHIGRHYFDHLHGIVGTLHPLDRPRIAALFDGFAVGGSKVGVKIAMPGRRAMVATLNAATPGAMLADLRVAGRRLATSRALARTIVPMVWRYMRHRRIAQLFGDTIPLGIECGQPVRDTNRVILEEGVAPARARAGVAWTRSGDMVPQIAAFAAEIGARLEAAGLARLELAPDFLAGKSDAIRGFHDACHHMGGTRMADSAEDGVVDTDCRVFGTENLYVAGAGVFPTCDWANPTLSAIALGQRLAMHLTERPQ